MKRTYTFLLCFTFLAFSFNCFAKKNKDHYYDDPDKIITVSELNEMEDDSYVSLEGFIIKRLSDEKFLFEDNTGEIILEIDRELNYQLKDINKNTQVKVFGEFDKEFVGKNKLEVKQIDIIK